jgi:hypothetical protein
MELDQLEDIDLNEFGDDSLASFEGAAIARPLRRRPRKPFVLPQTNDTPELKAHFDQLRAVQSQQQPRVLEAPEPNMVRGDRGKIQRSQTIAATLDIPFSEAYQGEAQYSKGLQAGAPDLFKEAGTSFMRGIGSAYKAWGGALGYLGATDFGQTYTDFGKSLENAYMPKLSKPETSWTNLSNPTWWATTVAESIPTTLSLIPPAIVGAYAATAAGGALALGAFGKTVLGALGATAVSRPMESAMEAAQTKEAALGRGMTEAQANQAADKVFHENLALGGLDVAQLAMAFTPLRVLGSHAPKALAARILATGGKVALGALSEGGEEAIQSAFQQDAIEGIGIFDSLKRFNPEMKEAAMIGGVFGVGLPVAGSAFNALTERITATLPDKLMETYQVNEQAALARGLDAQGAKLEALDTLASEPAGQAHIEKVMGELKDIAEGKEIIMPTADEMNADIEKFGGDKEFVMGEIVEPEGMDIASDEALDAIMAGDTSIDEALGLEPEVIVQDAMPQKGGPGITTETQAPKPEGGIVYHGGPSDSVEPQYGMAWFSESAEYARDFAGKAGTVKAATIDLKNPLDVSKLKGERSLAAWSKFLKSKGVDLSGVQLEDWAPQYGKYTFFDLLPHAGNNYFNGRDTGLIKALRAAGYDGLRAPSEVTNGIKSGKVFVAFDKSQISSSPNPSSPPSGGGQEFLVSEDSYQTALASLKSKSTGLHANIDPTVLADLAKIGTYHIERGLRTFAEWSKAMIAQLGEAFRPYLQEVWEQVKPLAEAEAVAGATMPAKDVKKQVRKVTGQTNLSKLVHEDAALRAGMKKAEQAARVAYAAGNKDAQAKAKDDLRDILIKAKVKAEQFGFREGFKVAEKLTRKELVESFKYEQEMMEETRKALIDIIQEDLPPELRGKFLDPIIAKLTERKQQDILDRVAAMKNKLTKDELIEDLKSLQKMRGNINVEYQKRVAALIGDIQTKNIGTHTRENVEGLLEFAEREGMPSGISPKTLMLIKRLEGRHASEMSIEDLKELTAAAKHLVEMGKLKQSLKYKYNERERQKALQQLLTTTNDIDPNTSGRDTQTDALKKGAMFIYTESLQAPRVTEIIDGYKPGENTKLLQRLNTAELEANWAIKTNVESAIHEAIDAGIGELTDEQQVRIMINIRNMEGADSQTLMLMEKFGYQEIPALSTQELALIAILKKYASDKFGDQIAAMFEEMTNVPFPRLEGRILPLKYEGEARLAPEEVILHTPHKMTQTEKGFTIERQQGVRKMPRVDVWGVFEQGMNEQLWFLHMQPVLNDIAHLVKTKEYVAQAGEVATNWWRDQLDITARRGWSVTAQHNAFATMLKTARGNMSTAILGYKLSSIIMQPFAVIDAIAFSQSRFGASAARKILAEFGKSWIVPGYAKQYIDADSTHSLTLRRGGEVAIEETLQKVGRSGGMKARFIRGGLSLMQKADVRTAAGVQQAFEKILTEEGVADPKREAANLMNLTQSSSDVTFRPHILARGEGARTWLTFQTFMLNRWGIMAHDLITKGLVKGEGRGRIAALVGLGILIAGKMAEDEAREYLYEIVKRRKLPDRSALQDAFFALPSNIPILGSIYETVSSRGGADIPIMKVLYDLGHVGAIPFMKPENMGKAAMKGAKAGAVLFGGVPGTTQTFDLIEAALFPEKATKPKSLVKGKEK